MEAKYRPWCEVAKAEIRTCNLPIANPALYHTATSAPAVEIIDLYLQCQAWWRGVMVRRCLGPYKKKKKKGGKAKEKK